MGARGCPTPTKRGWKTRSQARDVGWSLMRQSKKGDRLDLHPYRCPGCELWHIGRRGRAKAGKR